MNGLRFAVGGVIGAFSALGVFLFFAAYSLFVSQLLERLFEIEGQFLDNVTGFAVFVSVVAFGLAGLVSVAEPAGDGE